MAEMVSSHLFRKSINGCGCYGRAKLCGTSQYVLVTFVLRSQFFDQTCSFAEAYVEGTGRKVGCRYAPAVQAEISLSVNFDDRSMIPNNNNAATI